MEPSSDTSIENYFSKARWYLRSLANGLLSRGFRRECGLVSDMFEKLEFLEEYFKYESQSSTQTAKQEGS